jgi:hypothetical protein
MKSKLIVWLIRIALAIPAAIVGGGFGLMAGEAFAYLVAALTDRDIGALKDMLIWSNLTGCAICSLVAVWLVLRYTEAGRWAQRSALTAAGVAAIGGVSLMIASFDWPKRSGNPIIQYELRLPAGSPLPQRSEINLTVWREKSGQGCYIAQIRWADRRPEIVGDLTLYRNNDNPTISLQLNRATEGYWRLPYKPDAALEKSFGPWQRIEFIPGPSSLPPLLPGDYDIRYRVRRYL